MNPGHNEAPGTGQQQTLILRLYIAGNAPNSLKAVANLRALRQEFPEVVVELEIIDTLEQPRRAMADGVVVTPTLCRISPAPMVRLAGNLSRRPEVLMALGLKQTSG